MKLRWLMLILLPGIGGCLDLDFTGLGHAFSCTGCWDVGGGGGGGGYYAPLGYYGQISIGPYSAVDEEATVYVYDPDDLTVPLDSATSHGTEALFSSYSSTYTFDFGGAPAAAVCGYMAQVVLWNGDSSELLPLFETPPTSCDSLPAYMAVRNFELPEYEPLDQPLTLTGHAFVDGAPAPSGLRLDIYERLNREASVSPCARGSVVSVREWVPRYATPTNAECVPVFTDASGTYVYATADRAQWFVLCDLAVARVYLSGTVTTDAVLESSTRSTCAERTFPDIRQGSRLLAEGSVFVLGEDRWASTDEASVELLNPTDSTPIGSPSWTLDDGTFRLWYPDGIGDPPCDILIRATLAGGASVTRRLDPVATGSTCPYVFGRHAFVL